MERSDQVLVESARRGDKQAFDVLLERHQKAARRTGLRMLSSEEVVEQAGRIVREGVEMQEGIKEMPPPSGERFDIVLEEVKTRLRDVPGEGGCPGGVAPPLKGLSLLNDTCLVWRDLDAGRFDVATFEEPTRLSYQDAERRGGLRCRTS